MKAVFAVSDKTYQVEWTETIRGLSGQMNPRTTGKAPSQSP